VLSSSNEIKESSLLFYKSGWQGGGVGQLPSLPFTHTKKVDWEVAEAHPADLLFSPMKNDV